MIKNNNFFAPNKAETYLFTKYKNWLDKLNRCLPEDIYLKCYENICRVILFPSPYSHLGENESVIELDVLISTYLDYVNYTLCSNNMLLKFRFRGYSTRAIRLLRIYYLRIVS